MSSHHVIREGQEPAIYLRNNNHVILKILHNLLEWSPYLIVNSETIDFCRDHNIKPDAIISDDSGNFDFFLEKIPLSDHSKDLIAVKEWVKTKNCDQLLVLDDINKLKDINSPDSFFGLIDKDIKYSLITKNINKWFPEGQKLFLIKTESNQKIEFTNLKKINQTLIVSNTGLVNINSNNPFYLGELLE